MVIQQLPRKYALRLGFIILSLGTSILAVSEDRIALVIGNSTYTVGVLKNPANDAQDIASALRKLHFEVRYHENLTFVDMIKVFGEFSREASKYDVRLLYYAGHGFQYNDANYLMPVDAILNNAENLTRQMVIFDDLAEKLARIKQGVNVFILDACRDNPFTRSFSYGPDGRRVRIRGDQVDLKNGLTLPKVVNTGSFVAFSTKPGDVAEDNPKGRNSIYAKHLLNHIQTPGLRIEDLFQRVRRAVRMETQGLQVPWEQTSLESSLCLSMSADGRC
jgi:uncharacterized caspase-like protein